MAENGKKVLTKPAISPKINPDAFWNAVKRLAEEKNYGTLTIEFTVHSGKVCGAELIGSREKLGPY